MEQLGQENTDLSTQVATLEEAKVSMDDRIVELKVENKSMRKKAKANEVFLTLEMANESTIHCCEPNMALKKSIVYFLFKIHT